MNYFQQKYLFQRSRIDFTDTGILYAFGNVFNTKQLAIDYEEICFWKITREVKTDKFNLFVCIASAIMVLKSILGIYDNPEGIYKGLLPFSALFFIVFLVTVILGRINYVFIETTNGSAIKLLAYDKNATDVFLEELTIKTKTYLRDKYTDIESDLPVEIQLENLFWLKKIKVISKQEYDNLKNQLMKI